MSSNKVTIGISCGDLNGIGIEILIKIFKHKDLLESCTPVLYCPIKALNYYKKKLGFNNFGYVEIQKIENKIPGLLNIIPIINHDIDIKPGRVDKLLGKLALESIDITYGGAKFASFRGDARGAQPIRTDVNLTFRELEYADRHTLYGTGLTAEKFEKGSSDFEHADEFSSIQGSH